MKIGVIIAMEKELQRLLPLLHGVQKTELHGRTVYRGNIGDGKELFIRQSGIGKVNAAVSVSELITEYHPDCVISSGVAGGATTLVKRFEVVVSSEIVYHDVSCFSDNSYGQIQGMPPRFTADQRLLNVAKNIDNVHTGLIASGDYFVVTKAKAGEILDHFHDALAIDMESGALAQVCYIYNVPFISFRVISDIPLDCENAGSQQYDDFWQQVENSGFTAFCAFLQKIPALK